MKISRLEAYVKLVELKSFSRVAEEFNLTQPAVSIQLKNLEDFFQVKLVERKSDGVSLTPEGKLLYQEAKEIIQIWKDIQYKMDKLKDIVKGQLIIGASTIPAEYLLPQIIVEYSKKYPLVELKVDVKDSKTILDELIKGHCDVGLVGIKPDQEKLLAFPIASDELILIVPVNHPLVGREKVKKEELVDHKFILREEGSGTREAMKDGLIQIGLHLNKLLVAAEMGSTEAVIAGVEAGLGISTISSLAVRHVKKARKIKAVGIDGFEVKRQFYLAHSKKHYNQDLVKKFLEVVEKKCLKKFSE